MITAGVVSAIRRDHEAAVYQVDLERGGRVELAKSKIQFHPVERNLIVGTVLELTLVGSVVILARPVSEKDHATVSQIRLEQRVAVMLGRHVGKYEIRLDTGVLRQLVTGEELELEILYTAEGKRKFALSRAQTAQPAKPAPPARNPGPTGPFRATPPVSPPPRPPTPPPAERVEAEAYGVDLALLAEVKRAGHRHEIVAFLDKHARDGLIEWYSLKPGRAARYQQPGRPLQPQVRRAIGSALPEFEDLFMHQALALDAIRADRNLVLVTQTASGKTLGYNPAIFEYLLANPGGHVLYVFPLNALMLDQLEKLRQMVWALGEQGVKLSLAHMMGGMAVEERDAAARARPNIVVTNPEMLTFMLDRAERDWRDFFAGLKIIVIDEVHSYRGIFGVHMTGIVRRLLIAARRLDADPRLVISSATVTNPMDLAARLTALPESEFVLLAANEDGSQQADKHWLVLNPDWGARGVRYHNYQEVAADVFVEMLLSRNPAGKPAQLNTILFCRSMREVRAIKSLVDRRLDQKAPQLKAKVKSYISAALTAEVKREIYNGLKNGDLLGVISTNALEAGIDIGSLDACVIAGFPFSVMALRQMAGRVGRKKEGVVFFIPMPLSSLDQYYSEHPDLLLSQPPEEFVVDPQNPYIARKHINAAAYPTGLSDADLQRYWGPRAAEIVQQAQRDGVMQRRGSLWQGSRRDYRVQEDVYQVANIRSNVQRPYVICKAGLGNCAVQAGCFDPNKKSCEGRITLLDQQYVYRDCHPGAIYESVDQGLFRVTALDDANRVVKAEPLPEGSLDRTLVELDIAMELNGAPVARKEIIPGVEMAWGSATVTRQFTGYFQYTLQMARRCRRCRKEFDETIDACPTCHRSTESYYTHSKKERKDFPAPDQQGFQIVLKTVACWLTLKPEIEATLAACSPCKLPGEKNQVLAWLKRPLDLNALPKHWHVTEDEKKWIAGYHQQAAHPLMRAYNAAKDTLLYPGIYEQCLLAALRRQMNESRALELFQAISGYPVTHDLKHICRDCRRSVLLPAMHTLEHAVDARYPSVALGDRSDIGAFTTLGHATTGLPTIFWFDNYEGGLGAAEKIYTLILRLLEMGLEALQSCTCTTLEGCPRCTYIPDCGDRNESLSKPAGALLISKLLGRETTPNYPPYLYKKKRAEEFEKAYQENQSATQEHGIGEEAPGRVVASDPHRLLRLQPKVHQVVVKKAFEVRSAEIVAETPPVSAEQLNRAYQTLVNGALLKDWQARPTAPPYEVLEITPEASLEMVQKVYRVIAHQVHPDLNPGKTAWANELMKQVNAAYDAIVKEKSGRRR